MFERKFLAVGKGLGHEKFIILEKSNVGMMTKDEFALEVLGVINAGGGVTAYADMDSITIHEVCSSYAVPVIEVPKTELYAIAPRIPAKFNMGGINPDGILGIGLLGLAGYALGKSILNGTNRRSTD